MTDDTTRLIEELKADLATLAAALPRCHAAPRGEPLCEQPATRVCHEILDETWHRCDRHAALDAAEGLTFEELPYADVLRRLEPLRPNPKKALGFGRKTP